MTTQTAISNYDDIIDSRDVIERIAELTNERDEWVASDPDIINTVAQIEHNEMLWADEFPDKAAELQSLIGC